MPGLTIYKASAGSGKTFQLTGEYLKLAFDPKNSFKQILAVTFTKKATAEMRDRILKELYLISLGETTGHQQTLKNEFHLTDVEVTQRAKDILNQILHNYSYFQISTIDSFFQIILKAFTRELGIDAGFLVELDFNQALEMSVQQFFDRLDETPEIKKWLSTYALRKIEKGLSWDIQKDILKFAGNAFTEVFFSFPEMYLKELASLDNFEAIKKNLTGYLNNFTVQAQRFGQQGIQLMKQSGVDMDSFSHKKSGVGGYFHKLADAKAFAYPEPNSYVLKALQSPDGIEGWCAKTSPDRFKIQACVQGGLQQVLQNYFAFYEPHKMDFNTALEIEKNLDVFAILVQLFNHLTEYCQQQNIFLLQLTAPLLSKMIQDSDAPFIYEKTGNVLKFFMIDEFQDTSSLQWNNFYPLIANSMAQGSQSLVVGDVKQSIYRWRNSNWQLLHSQLKKQFQFYHPTEKNLPYNYRSLKEVVAFNNWCFSYLAKAIDQQLVAAGTTLGEDQQLKLEQIFEGAEQQIPKKAKPGVGHVAIQFFDAKEEDTSFEERTLEVMVQNLQTLFSNGFQPRDIAILVRRNKEGAAVAKALMDYKTQHPEWENQFAFVSNDSVLLSASNTINYIVAAMRYLVEPRNQLNNAQLAYFVGLQTLTPSESIARLAQLPLSDPESFESHLPANFVQKLHTLRLLSVNQMTEQLLQLLCYDSMPEQILSEWPFIHSFKDLVQKYSKTQGVDVAGFLEWWNASAKDSAINLSEEQNAIRILTIHKSKGLEYKAVLVPFADWDVEQRNKLLWCQTQPMDFLPSLLFPVNYSSKLINTHFNEAYYKENLMVWVDNLNLLYVAFTRARIVLMVNAPLPKKTDEIKNVGGMLYSLVQPNTLNKLPHSDWNDEKLKLSIGQLQLEIADKETSGSVPEAPKIGYRKTPIKLILRSNLSALFEDNPENSFMNKGKIYHMLFEKIRVQTDFKPTLQTYYKQGFINQMERDELHELWNQALTQPLVLDWFGGSWQIVNEISILLPNGDVKRPDRVMMNETECLVVDYKFTTTHQPNHIKQVEEYIRLISAIQQKKTTGYVWYLPNNLIIPVQPFVAK
ncbi:MAG TPA: hypothetical protein DD653_12490 [Marinilabiliales bacterium]|nr:hypothetical protein [Marinilabiliales bacterium]